MYLKSVSKNLKIKLKKELSEKVSKGAVRVTACVPHLYSIFQHQSKRDRKQGLLPGRRVREMLFKEQTCNEI